MTDEPTRATPPPPPPAGAPAVGSAPPPPPPSAGPDPSRSGVPAPPPFADRAAGPINTTRGILLGAVTAAVTAAIIYGITAATDRFFVYGFILAGLAVGTLAKIGAGGKLPTTTALVIGAVTIVAMLMAATLLAGREDDTLAEFIERNPLTVVMMIGAGLVAGFVAAKDSPAAG